MILCVRSEFRLQLGAVQSDLPWVHVSGAQFVRLCCRPSLQEPPRWSPGPQMEAKQNTLAQAGVRRNRLKNNTTRLSPAPDQAICNCWHKRTLAGYPTVLASLGARPIGGYEERNRSLLRARIALEQTGSVRRHDRQPIGHRWPTLIM